MLISMHLNTECSALIKHRFMMGEGKKNPARRYLINSRINGILVSEKLAFCSYYIFFFPNGYSCLLDFIHYSLDVVWQADFKLEKFS